MEGKTVININTGTMVKAIIIGLLFWTAYRLQHLILVILVSVVIATIVDQGSKFLAHFKISRFWSVLGIYILAFAVFFFGISFLLPPLFSDLTDLAVGLPDKLIQIGQINISTDPISSITGGLAKSFTLSDLVVQSQKFILKLSDSVFSTTSVIFGGFFSFILILVISFYLSVQEKGIEGFLRLVVPIKHEDYAIDLWRRSQTKIGLWFQGQIVLGLIIGGVVFIGLWLSGVKYALTLGLIAAALEIIPFFGPILSAIPGVLLGLSDGLGTGIFVLIFYIVIQQLEGHVVYPLVANKVVGIPPLVVILALLVGAELYGFLGILVAVPLTTVLMEMANDLEKHKTSIRQRTENT